MLALRNLKFETKPAEWLDDRVIILRDKDHDRYGIARINLHNRTIDMIIEKPIGEAKPGLITFGDRTKKLEPEQLFYMMTMNMLMIKFEDLNGDIEREDLLPSTEGLEHRYLTF